MTSQEQGNCGQEGGGGEPDNDHHNTIEKLHLGVIQLVNDEKSKINKDVGRQILLIFAQMMTLVGKQNTENVILKTRLEERGRSHSYADVLRTHSDMPLDPGAMQISATRQETANIIQLRTSPSRPKNALLIYLRNSTTTASKDIKVLLKKYFDPHALGLSGVTLREIRDGLAAQSDSAQELESLYQAIEQHPSTRDMFVLRKPNKRNPQFRISGVDPDILPAELLATLNTQNSDLKIEPQDFTHRTSYKEKSGNVTHIIEVKAPVYQRIQSKEKVHLGWTSCPITENFYVPRCTKCCQYGHTKAKCISKSGFCTICAENHPTTECTITRYQDGKCRACQNRRLHANHPFGASECGTLAFHITRLRAQTDYPQ